MATELASGQVLLDRYRLDRRLDEGGMSVVWAGTRIATGQAVALKLLKADGAADELTRRRMLHEAKAACAVVHPNVVAIHDVLVLADGSPVLVMDLLEGESLRERLARRKVLSVGETATLLLPVISGAGTAHAVGVVHRDLKPENIFLANEGGEVVVKVLDFGIAKILAPIAGTLGAGALTSTGTMLGTPYYMAPEQILCEPIDHRADVWSLGVILYECLTGARPTEADNVGKILKRVLTHDIEPLSVRAPGLPADVTGLVDRMLQQRREDRPASMREVGEALAAHAEGVSLGDFGPPNTLPASDPAAPAAALNRASERPAPSSRDPGTAPEFAETLMAPRPAELGAGPREGVIARAGQSAATAPLPGSKVAVAIGAFVMLAAVGAAGYLGLGRGKERLPYVPASAVVVAAPLNKGCPPGMKPAPGGAIEKELDGGRDDEPSHRDRDGTRCVKDEAARKPAAD